MVLNFAHRGSLNEAPENTVAAMKKAMAHGAQGIELDVRLTKDRQLVVIHDHHFKRLNKKVPGQINDYTLGEIKQIDVGSSFSKSFAGERLATLEEILSIVPPEIVLNIEIKNTPIIHTGIEEIVIDCLQNLQREKNIIISSFDHEVLRKIQQLAPQFAIGLLFNYRLIRPWNYAKQTGLDIFSIHPNAVYLNAKLIGAFHEAGYKVFPYTVNRMEDYQRMVSIGVDGVFSNNPTIFGRI